VKDSGAGFSGESQLMPPHVQQMDRAACCILGKQPGQAMTPGPCLVLTGPQWVGMDLGALWG
jgi:hypothetical protein